MSFEHLVLNQLLTHEEYTRKVIPFVEPDYFSDTVDRTIFNLTRDFINKYNTLPSREALHVDLEEMVSLNESEFARARQTIEEVVQPLAANPELEWMYTKTEKFCQERAIYNAIIESMKIIDDKNSPQAKGAIPDLLSKALGVTFNASIGHSYEEDIDERFEFYHSVEERIPFDIEYLNNITKGGLPRKTLNVLLAGTNVGKTLAMCHMAAANYAMGKNVLYISLEMARLRIAERIDANLLDIAIDNLKGLPYDTFKRKVEFVRKRTPGRLIVEEFPTSSASVVHIKHLLNELKLKRKFVPDIIYIDYLNIAASSRVKLGGANTSSYSYIKSIAEEFRGLAVEQNVPIVSATQVNREGFNNSDFDMTNTSESFGLPMTVDWLVAMISSDELRARNQIMFKQLKSRYDDPERVKRFVIGVDKPKMRLYNVEETAQKELSDRGDIDDEFEVTKDGDLIIKPDFKPTLFN